MTEWSDEAMTRQGLYRFLGAAMMPPETDRLRLLSASVELLNGRGLDGHPYSLAWRRFAGALVSVDDVGAVGTAYVRLFGVGMAGTPAPANESYYRFASPGVGVAAFISAIEAEYRSMGVTTVPGGEAPDHVSTQLEVMSYQCGAEAASWLAGDTDGAMARQDTELRFIRAHLAGWIPRFAELVRSAHPTEFYASLSGLIEAVTTHEVDYLGAVVAGRATP